MKPSGVKYITNYYPLVEMNMSRDDCLQWMKAKGYPMPSKSACYFCPYTSDARFREMKMTDPDSWGKALAFDNAMRQTRVAKLAAGIKGEIFVHRSMTPLESVDLRNAEDAGQLSMFGNECEGMCGV